MEKPFVLPIRTPLGAYIYDGNNNEILFVGESVFSYICNVLNSDGNSNCDPSDEIQQYVKKLNECGYLLPSNVKQIFHPLTQISEFLLNRSIGNLVLQVTQSCNLRCRYCIYSESSNLSQRSHSSRTMSFEIAKKAIDFYKEHTIDSDRAEIGFYGGEPLLAFPLIKRIVCYCEQIFEGKEISYNITTNATLLDDEIIDFMLTHNFKTVFSLDGPKPVQDKNRIFPNGKGSFDIVMKNIRRFYEKDSKNLQGTSISMVIDPEQDYVGLLPLLKEPIFKNTLLSSSMIERDLETIPASAEYVRDYNYDAFLALAEFFRSEYTGERNKLMENYISNFLSDKKDFVKSSLASISAPSGPCVPGKPRLFVNCFGDFYPCEKVNENSWMKIGSINYGFDYERVKELLNLAQLDAERCKECWAFSLCDICAKRIDDGEGISAKQRNKACVESQKNAYYTILQQIVLYENEQHIREVLNWKEE